MKKEIYLFCLSFGLILTACSGNINSNSEPSLETSYQPSQAVSTDVPSVPSVPSVMDSLSVSTLSTPQLTAEEALNLVLGAYIIDIENAQESTMTIDILGYLDGRQYYQQETYESKSYLQNDVNNLTISSGSVEQYYLDDEDTIYSDEFDQVITIEGSDYINTRVFKNGVFNDETERINLLLADPSTIQEIFEYYSSLATCGAGSYAYDDLAYAYELAASMSFTSQVLTNGDVKILFVAEAENSQSNEKFIGQYEYLFDARVDGFLKKYKSIQALYSLDLYEASEDTSTLTPNYSAIMNISVTKGVLGEFEGNLPIDIHSTFVSEIILTAAKTTIEVEEKVALSATVLPETAIDKSLSFSSSNDSIARVNYDGVIEGIKVGSCEIIATNIDSGVEGRIKITVIEKQKPDSGDDALKSDLKKALDAALYQSFAKTNLVGGSWVDSITGMCIDDNRVNNINAIVISNISLSDFAWNPNLRTATYIGSMDKIVKILPYKNNGNDNLPNNYQLINRNTIYHDVCLSFEIILGTSNTINYLHFKLRTDYVDYNSSVDFATLNSNNITTLMGEFKSGNARDLYYESKGFDYSYE